MDDGVDGDVTLLRSQFVVEAKHEKSDCFRSIFKSFILVPREDCQVFDDGDVCFIFCLVST